MSERDITLLSFAIVYIYLMALILTNGSDHTFIGIQIFIL